MDNIDEFLAHVRENIDQHGWHAQGVGARPDRPTYTYTVGLTAMGFEELVVVGLLPSQAHEVLTGGVRLLQDGVGLHAGRIVQGLLEGLPIKTTDCSNEHLNVARSVYGVEVMAVQLVWPDAAGRFPGEPGHDDSLPSQRL